MNRIIFLFILFFSILFYTNTIAQNLSGIGAIKNKVPTFSTYLNRSTLFQTQSDSAHKAWVSIYNDPINGDDEADAMALDIFGNIYVTGNTSDWDITTIKYNPDGVQQWIYVFNGSAGGDDVPYDIAVDRHGNAYISGYSDENGQYNYNFLTMKIDSSGNIIWANLITNLPGPYNDVAFGVAVDESGNVYSTGATFVTSDFDLTTVKYNAAGTQQWIQHYNSPYNLEDTGNDLVLDSDGNVYITGVSQQAPGNYDVITLKYNTNGSMQWVTRYNGPGNSNDGGIRLALDGKSNVIVTGYQTGSGTLFDMLTIKYDNEGNQKWISVFNGSVNSHDASNNLVVDAAGNIYITGFATGTNNTSDYATLKYNPSGAQQWVAIYTGPANGYEQAYGIALDNSDGVYISGYSPSVVTPYVHYEYATVKYDTSGQEQWVSRYSGNSSLIYEPNVAKSIVVDNSGNVYVTGEIANEDVGEDFGTIKYIQIPTPVELTSFIASISGNDVILNWSTATEINNHGFEVQRSTSSAEFVTIGFVEGSGTTTETKSYTFKDKDVPTGSYRYRLKQVDFNGKYNFSKELEIIVDLLPKEYRLSQNFPNPFNPSTVIELSLPEDVSNAKLSIYNVLGEKVAELVNTSLTAGKYSYQWNAKNVATGMYIYELRTDKFVSVKKMLLMK